MPEGKAKRLKEGCVDLFVQEKNGVIKSIIMAKAKLTLPNGTEVTIEGTAEEVHKLLELYSGSGSGSSTSSTSKIEVKGVKGKKSTKVKDDNDLSGKNLITKVVNKVKECDEAELIEENILDRISRVNRTLLPLYIIHEYFDNGFDLQSGEISKITSELGIRISQPNVSTTLTGSASRYVVANKAKKGKQAIKYKINRRGVQYLKAVIQGDSDE